MLSNDVDVVWVCDPLRKKRILSVTLNTCGDGECQEDASEAYVAPRQSSVGLIRSCLGMSIGEDPVLTNSSHRAVVFESFVARCLDFLYNSQRKKEGRSKYV